MGSAESGEPRGSSSSSTTPVQVTPPSGPASGRGGPAGDGHDARARCDDRRPTRPWAPTIHGWRGDERRRGGAQRLHHRCPPARRDELPQLRRPARPEAFWQPPEAVRGLADACRALELPVTGGNVSLYNESPRGRSPRHPRSAWSASSRT